MPDNSRFKKSKPEVFVAAEIVMVTVLELEFTTTPSSASPPFVAVSLASSSVSAVSPEQALPPAPVPFHLNLTVVRKRYSLEDILIQLSLSVSNRF